MNRHEVEEVLHMANSAKIRITQLREQIAELQHQTVTVSQSIKENSIMPTGVKADKLLDIEIRKQALVDKLQVEYLQWLNKYKAAEDLISRVPNGKIQAILTQRFIFGRKVENLCRTFGYERQRIWQLYKQGVDIIAKDTRGLSKRKYFDGL